ncbi:hypothetical protein [Thermogemmatispora tikiterensis]|uniref:Tyr recombinase domain-containing protein n=1 Tax=Thermogemmatispora tikiterensis TaxID=1825093 RepID=A0A328VP83_9CHLR|nr:hypothetical protein [Thermogemmatispora tikiterensis]RAQ97483.1 hypothetical protein A4R35_18235 [Thermogemmatispora tikiterensis]
MAQDRELSPAHWQELRAGDLNKAAGMVLVRRGTGGRRRLAPVLPSVEELLQRLRRGRQPEERIFARIPSHLDVHALRREDAQALYRLLSRRELPPATGRLRPSDYDQVAVTQVAVAQGHNRLDVVLRHYLR